MESRHGGSRFGQVEDPSRTRAIRRPTRPSPRNYPRPLPSPSILRHPWICRKPCRISISTGRSTIPNRLTANSTTPNRITTLFCISISTPIPHRFFPLHNPFPCALLRPLTRASRCDTSALAEPTDSLLRFVTPSPPFSSYPRQLANSLSAGTLGFYAALTSYGTCSHIAAIPSTHIAKLHNPSLSRTSAPLCLFRPALLDARIVRATDPHQTIPNHNALWSGVAAWSWGASVLHFGYQLRIHDYLRLWSDLWRCLSTQLEVLRANGISGGAKDRFSVVEVIRRGFDRGPEKDVFTFTFGICDNSLGISETSIG